MKILRDTVEEERIYGELEAYLRSTERERRPHEFHVSDLLSPRQAYFKRKDPKPYTKEQIGYFLGGQGHHFIAEISIAGAGGTREERITLPLGDNLIIGTPDVQRGDPLEFKTSRKWTIPETPATHYVDQLLMYCALKGVRGGKVIVFFLTPGRKWDASHATGPELVAWDIRFTDEELDQARDFLGITAETLTDALAANDHQDLPLCESWMCGKKGKKGDAKVNCPWYEKCQPPGRYPARNLDS